MSSFYTLTSETLTFKAPVLYCYLVQDTGFRKLCNNLKVTQVHL